MDGVYSTIKKLTQQGFKYLTAVSLLNFINDGTNQKKGTYKMREPYKSVTFCNISQGKKEPLSLYRVNKLQGRPRDKDKGCQVVPISRGGSRFQQLGL
jgi:hypothetical protein